MPNKVYPKFLLSLGKAEINLSTANIKIVLVDTGAYTYGAAHEFLSDIAVGARIATSGNLTTVTWALVTDEPVLDADDIVISGVTGASIEAKVAYIDTGVAATSRLINFEDTPTSGLPLTPNGGSVTIAFSAGVNKILRISQ